MKPPPPAGPPGQHLHTAQILCLLTLALTPYPHTDHQHKAVPFSTVKVPAPGRKPAAHTLTQITRAHTHTNTNTHTHTDQQRKAIWYLTVRLPGPGWNSRQCLFLLRATCRAGATRVVDGMDMRMRPLWGGAEEGAGTSGAAAAAAAAALASGGAVGGKGGGAAEGGGGGCKCMCVYEHVCMYGHLLFQSLHADPFTKEAKEEDNIISSLVPAACRLSKL
eukprot:366543-Pelagomonas_calceolata.AAC.2